MFHTTRNPRRMINSPSQQHDTPQLTVIDGEGRSSRSSTKYYPSDHPFSSVADRQTPYKKIFSAHPVRSGASISHRRTPRRRGPKQSPAAASFQSPPTSSRAAWNSTNNDLSIYSLTEEEQQRRKKILRTPVDTGRRKPHRMKSVAPSPGGATGPKKYATPTTSVAPAKMKRAWCPSGKTSGKGLVERTPGFVDDSWMKYAKNKQEEAHGIDEEADVDGNGAHDGNLPNNGDIDRAEADATDATEYNDIDRGADPFRTSSVSAAQRKQTHVAVKKKKSAAAAAVSSFRKPVGTKMSLHTASKAWAKRKESHSDVFTAQDAKLMSALRGVETTPSEQPTSTGTMPTPQAPTTPMTPMTPMVTMTPRSVKRSMVVPPRPIKASTELGRRQRAEQENAFMELEAQLSRLRVVKGIVVPQLPESESTLQASPGGGNAPEERDVVTKHWIGFHTNVPSTTALFNNTPNPTYNTRTMLTSLAHVASTLASSLAENEIRLQEESKARIHMQDLLLDTQSELKHLKAQQSEDSDAIARMITQMPDVALNYLTTSPSASPAVSPVASPVVSPVVSPPLPTDVLRGETSLASVAPLLPGSAPPSEYSSLLLNHATTMKEDDLTNEKTEEERFAMTSQDVVAVASLPEMGTANDEEGGEEEHEDIPKPTVVHAGYNPRTTTQMGFTITEFVSVPSNNNEHSTDNHEDEEMARQNIPSPAPRTSVPTPTISSGPGYRNVVLDSPLEAPLGKISYNSYMKRPSTNEKKTQRTSVSPVRQKTNAAAAWLRRRK